MLGKGVIPNNQFLSKGNRSIENLNELDKFISHEHLKMDGRFTFSEVNFTKRGLDVPD